MKIEYVIITYIIGFLLSYIIIKKFGRTNDNANEWSDVMFTFLLSMFSWFILIVIGVIEYKKIFKMLGIRTFKPPKWL